MEEITIEEAIKTLSDSANAGLTTFDEKYKAAQRLGIEALKREQAHRKRLVLTEPELLPGETKD